MKKLLWIVVTLLLVVATGRAGDYLDDYTDLAKQARLNLGYDTSSAAPVTNTEFAYYTRQGLAELTALVQSIHKVRVKTTTRGKQGYALDSTVVGVIGVEWIKGDSIKVMLNDPRESYGDKMLNTLVGKQGYEGRPSWYTYTDDSLYLYPIPWLAGDTIKIFVWEKPVNIDTLTVLTQLKLPMRQALLHYVCYRVAMAKIDPRAELYYRDYSAYVGALLQQRGMSAKVTASNK